MYRNTNHIYLIEIIFIESIDYLNTDQPKTASETNLFTYRKTTNILGIRSSFESLYNIFFSEF